MRKKKTEDVKNLDNVVDAGTAQNNNELEVKTGNDIPTEKPKAKRGRPKKKIEAPEQPESQVFEQPVLEAVKPEFENPIITQMEAAPAAAKVEKIKISPVAIEEKKAEIPVVPEPSQAVNGVEQVPAPAKENEAPAKNINPNAQGKKHFNKNKNNNNFNRKNRFHKKRRSQNGKPQLQNNKPKIDNDPYRKPHDPNKKQGFEQNKQQPKNNTNQPGGKKKRHPHNPQYGGTLENQKTVIPGASNRYRRSYMNRQNRTGGQGANPAAPPRKRSTSADSSLYGSSKQQEVYTHYDERSVFGGSDSGRRSIKSETKKRWNEKFGGRRRPKSDGRDKSR